MGGTLWDDDFYKEREVVRAKTGKSAFIHNDAVKAKPRDEQHTHEKMNPLGVTRESRDSAAHPNSIAIGVIFDVTGSMGRIPVGLQKKLPALMGTINDRHYIADPQILMGAVGDATCDRGSIQIGQFESGIEVDDDLGRMWIEEGGGGNIHESYQNAIYFFARHTSCDCWEKRGKKGYLFLMGDELPYDVVSKSEVRTLFGDTLQEDIPLQDIVREAQERWNIFFIIPMGATHARDPQIFRRWAEVLGEDHVLQLSNPDGVCETITMAIGINEGTVNIEKAQDDLSTAGSKAAHVNAAAASLNRLAEKHGAVGRTLRL